MPTKVQDTPVDPDVIMEEATVTRTEATTTQPPPIQEDTPVPTAEEEKETPLTTTTNAEPMPTIVKPIKPTTKDKPQEATEEIKRDEPITEVTTPTTKKEDKEKGTPTDLIPIEETPKEREDAAAKRARLQPVLRRSAVTKIGLFTNKEKEKILEPIQKDMDKAKEKELAAILALVKPSLLMDEFTPLNTAMYEAGSSSQAATHTEEQEG